MTTLQRKLVKAAAAFMLIAAAAPGTLSMRVQAAVDPTTPGTGFVFEQTYSTSHVKDFHRSSTHLPGCSGGGADCDQVGETEHAFELQNVFTDERVPLSNIYISDDYYIQLRKYNGNSAIVLYNADGEFVRIVQRTVSVKFYGTDNEGNMYIYVRGDMLGNLISLNRPLPNGGTVDFVVKGFGGELDTLSTSAFDCTSGYHEFHNKPSDVIVSPANCTEAAVVKVRCDLCQAVSDTETVHYGEPEHQFHTLASGEIVSQATCTSPRMERVKCDRCEVVSDTLTVGVGDLLPHSFTTNPSDQTVSPASCTERAAVKVKCDHCEAVSENDTVEVGELLPHSFTTCPSDQVVSPASCTERAVVKVKCDHCDAVSENDTVEVGDVQHSFTTCPSDQVVSEANCTAPKMVRVKCDNCEVVSDTETVAVGDVQHHYTENPDIIYRVSEATYTNRAVYKKSCSLCGNASEETFEYGDVLTQNSSEQETSGGEAAEPNVPEPSGGEAAEPNVPDTSDEASAPVNSDTAQPDAAGEQQTIYSSKNKDKAVSVLITKAKLDNKKVKLTWTKVKGATSYTIYASTCGKGYKEKATVKGTQYTIRKLNNKKEYKFYVKANGVDSSVASVTCHVAMPKNKHTNPKSISVNVKKVTLKAGKTKTIKARIKKAKSGRKLVGHVASVRYYTADASVATVAAKGRITAAGKGKTEIYAVAENGLSKTIKVTVK